MFKIDAYVWHAASGRRGKITGTYWNKGAGRLFVDVAFKEGNERIWAQFLTVQTYVRGK